jgi:hypothetical protein
VNAVLRSWYERWGWGAVTPAVMAGTHCRKDFSRSVSRGVHWTPLGTLPSGYGSRRRRPYPQVQVPRTDADCPRNVSRDAKRVWPRRTAALGAVRRLRSVRRKKRSSHAQLAVIARVERFWLNPTVRPSSAIALVLKGFLSSFHPSW